MSLPNLTTPSLLTLYHTIAAPLLRSSPYPWDALPGIAEFILALGPTLDPDRFICRDSGIWIAKTAKIAATASITGPAIICDDAELRHCAFIRGSVIIGAGATVGNSCEIKNSILFDAAAVSHFNYVGDSILGHSAHMGAGAITSNVKSDRTPVVIRDANDKIPTGLRKFGAIIGDHGEIGCNCVLNPGTIIGRGSRVYPLSSVRGVVPEHSIYKSAGCIVPIS